METQIAKLNSAFQITECKEILFYIIQKLDKFKISINSARNRAEKKNCDQLYTNST